jgi:hypothetical protein
MLTLPIKEKWLREIWEQRKFEEYRTDSEYWDARLLRYENKVVKIRLRAGYQQSSPAVVCVVVPHRRQMGKSELGAPETPCWVLEILGIARTEEEGAENIWKS